MVDIGSVLSIHGCITLYFVSCNLCVLCFLLVRHYASAGLCDSDVSVRTSVRLSVTHRYCA